MAPKTALEVLSSRDALVFVSELANRITIITRGAYRGADEPDVVKLKAANETLHALSAKLVGLSRGSERFPDAAFLESVQERAGAFGADFDWALADALKATTKRSKQG
jgi:hypothetical protein